MKPRHLIVLLSGLLVASAVRTVRADGFELPDLNPFASKSESARSPQSTAKRGLTLPKMELPKVELPKMSLAPARRSTPTTWQRMQQGTGQFFSALNPWSKPNPRSRSRKRSGNSSAFSWLFPSKKKEKEIKDVNDFLKLPRPDYD
jgi:hypothetical protein